MAVSAISHISVLRVNKNTIKNRSEEYICAAQPLFSLKTKGLFCFPSHRMQTVGLALEELLVKAQRQNCLVVGLYESAKVLTA